MEAINNLASAATKAIWGENNEKDGSKGNVSGIQGDTSKGEPFDAGNMGEPSEVAAKSPGNGGEPTTAQPSSNMAGDSTHAQNDTRPPSDENTSPDSGEAKSDVDNVEPLDPKSLKGPGPKPLAELAKENGGDVGNMGKNKGADANEPPTGGAAAKGTKDGDGGSEEKSESEGTGERYVKSSGVQADGGDFDAANPGAGREAERLLEEKGIHVEKPGDKKMPSTSPKDKDTSSGKSSSPERKGVKGLGQKIKAKLRRSPNA